MGEWYALHTKAQKEELAARDLRRRGFEVFWPFTSHWIGTGHKERSRLVKRGYFSRYLFVLASQEQLYEIQDDRAQNMGVSTILRLTNNEPTAIPPSAMQELFKITDHLGEVHEKDHSKNAGRLFSNGDLARVVDEQHPLFGFLVEVQKQLDNGAIVANMFAKSLLGSQVITFESPDSVEAVTAGENVRPASSLPNRGINAA